MLNVYIIGVGIEHQVGRQPVWVQVSPSVGLNSAVGTAVAISRRAGSWCLSDAYSNIFFKSPLDMPPIGLTSALEQSYFVMYPRRASSTFALPKHLHRWLGQKHQYYQKLASVFVPSTKRKPLWPRVQGNNIEHRYASTILILALK